MHCAGAGRRLRVLDKDGEPGSLEDFEWVMKLNVTGSFNALRLGAARMARTEPVDGERGAIVLTASVAAYEGQIGQLPYTASKAAIVGMTLNAARDLASKAIRVCTIAPGIMDTPLLARLRDDVRASLEASVPNPPRLGHTAEFGQLAAPDPGERLPQRRDDPPRRRHPHGAALTGSAPAAGGPAAARHPAQVPKISSVWLTSAKPCSPATRSAHCSTAGPSTSTVRPQPRQTRWWWCCGLHRR